LAIWGYLALEDKANFKHKLTGYGRKILSLFQGLSIESSPLQETTFQTSTGSMSPLQVAAFALIS